MRIRSPMLFLVLTAALAVAVCGGCTDRGEDLMGAGPDDRTDRGNEPDSISVSASADTYFERTINDGSYLVAGELPSGGFQAVAFVAFEALPAADAVLDEAYLVLYTVGDDPPYRLRVSRLEEPPPSEFPFWPGPPESEAVVDTAVSTTEDTTAAVEGINFVKVEIPTSWVAGWISDPSSNYGLRIAGGPLNAGQSDLIEKRFWSGGQTLNTVRLGPQLEILRQGQTDSERLTSTEDFFVHSPSIEAVGEEPFTRVGGVFGYRSVYEFRVGVFSDSASVNKALLRLKVESGRPDLNEGIFDALAAPVLGAWKEDSTNVDVEIGISTTGQVEIDAEEGIDGEIVFDVTALVELFTENDVFEVAVYRTGVFSFSDQVALHSSETADPSDAPTLTILFTMPPGGRFEP